MSTLTSYTQKSYWLNVYGPYAPNEPLRGDLTVDVAIIGGGYTGLATAYFLKRAEPAMRVAVLEGEVVGYGASGRNGGFAMTLAGTGGDGGVWQARTAGRIAANARRSARSDPQHGMQAAEYTGFLRLATTRGFVKRIHDSEVLTSQASPALNGSIRQGGPNQQPDRPRRW
jgi:glycine/D-amino acid oxidase-like deaminating enzyme